MVDWSRELLDPPDRDLFQRLAVIPAPFTAETAVAVAGRAPRRPSGAGWPPWSSSRCSRSTSTTARPRATGCSRPSGSTARRGSTPPARRSDAMTGLVRWAAAEAVRLAAGFVGSGQIGAFDRCAAEQETFLAALRWAVEHDDPSGAVDITAALFHLWSVRGLHLEVIEWAQRVLLADDPAARRASPIYQGHRVRPPAARRRPAGGDLPVLASVNAGVTASQRLVALAGGPCRLLTAERPAEVSPRFAALVATLPALASTDRPSPGRRRAPGGRRRRLPARVSGCSCEPPRGRTPATRTTSSADARAAYRRVRVDRRPLGHGDGRAGRRAVGERARRNRTRRSGWSAACAHLELVGAMQDVRSIRVMLDVQRALGGDDDALTRLREVTTSTQVDDVDAAQALLGLAHVACAGRACAGGARQRGGRSRDRGLDDACPCPRCASRSAWPPPSRTCASPPCSRRRADASVATAVELLAAAARRGPGHHRHAGAGVVRARGRRAGGPPRRHRARPRAVGAGHPARRQPRDDVPAGDRADRWPTPSATTTTASACWPRGANGRRRPRPTGSGS